MLVLYIRKIKCTSVTLASLIYSFPVSLAESPDSYLEEKVFPILLPALEQMLRTAVETEVSAGCRVHCSARLG